MLFSSPTESKATRKINQLCDRLGLDLRKGKRLMGGGEFGLGREGDRQALPLSVASFPPGPRENSCASGQSREPVRCFGAEPPLATG